MLSGQPKEIDVGNGEKMWLITLDTEGLGGLEASQNYDARIFSLATLLCSDLMYNSQGSIDEKAINGLSFIANLTKHIRVQAESDVKGDELQEFFPSFLWIVRDFALELVDEDGDPITSTEYLARALAPDRSMNQSSMERNRVRQMMTAFFKKRNCFTIVRPVEDEEQLQQIDEIPIEKMRTEFQEQLSELKALVFSSLNPKMLNGEYLNGSMFASMVEAYVNAINDGGVPTISSAWDDIMLSECRNAMNTTLTAFQSELEQLTRGGLPMDQVELLVSMYIARDKGLQKFKTLAVGGMIPKFETELMEKMQKEMDALAERNIKVSDESCTRLFKELYLQDIQARLKSETTCYREVAEFAADWDVVKSKYMKVGVVFLVPSATSYD